MDRRAFIQRAAFGSIIVFSGRHFEAFAQTPEPSDSDDPWVIGNAFDLIQPGTPDTFEPVVVSPAFGDYSATVGVVLRNNLGRTAYFSDLIVTARDDTGGLIGAAGFTDAAPTVVEDGALCLARVYFDISPPPPPSTTYEIDVEWDEDQSFISRANILIPEIVVNGDRVVGIIENSGDSTVSVVKIIGLFFDDSGIPVGFVEAYGDKDELELGESSPFSSNVRGQVTDHYLIGATAWEM